MSAGADYQTSSAGPNGEFECDTSVPCHCGAAVGEPCATDECGTWGDPR